MNNLSIVEANLILDHARGYLERQSYASVIVKWVNGVDAAIALLEQAQADVNADVNAPTPEPTRIVFIDLDAIEREVVAEVERMAFKVIAASIEDKNVQAMLPFQTSLELGETFVHIVNESFYNVPTNSHEITQGETLCARGGRPRGTVTQGIATCPGCLIKAKNTVVRYLLKKKDGDYLRVARMIQDRQ